MTSRVTEDSWDDYFLPDLCTLPAVFLVTLAAELLAIVLVLARGPLALFDWAAFGLVSLMVQCVALVSTALLCQLRGAMQRLPRSWAGLSSYLLILLVTFVLSLVAGRALAFLSIEPDAPIDVWRNVLISALIGGVVLRYFYLQDELGRRQRMALEARIQALQSRIRPHFLFNSMNIIASLIPVDPDKAERVVEDLSELFRASLTAAGELPWREELELCQRYVHIEQLRLGRRLQVEWQLGSIPADVRIPMLTLQPLIENAIYHGIQPLPDGGIIQVKLGWWHGRVEVEVRNPLGRSGSSQSTHKGNSMALRNIRERLVVLYGEQAGLSSGPEQGEYVTRLSYPFRHTLSPADPCGIEGARESAQGAAGSFFGKNRVKQQKPNRDSAVAQAPARGEQR